MTHALIVTGTEYVLHIAGTLDTLSRPALMPVLDALVEAAPPTVRVDLSELRLIDGSGVAALVSLFKRFRAKGGLVRFVGVKAQPLVLFKLLRLDQAFQLS